jgi:hypothetical protein
MTLIPKTFRFAAMTHAIMGMINQSFRTAVGVCHTQPKDFNTIKYALKQHDAQVMQTFSPFVIATKENPQLVNEDNNLWDVARAKRIGTWLSMVGPHITRNYDAIAFELYLRTLAVSAEATTRGEGKDSNKMVTQAYAQILPIAAACSHANPAEKTPGLDIYVRYLGRVWDAAAFYEGHKNEMAASLMNQVEVTSRRKLWGEDSNPRFAFHRTSILRLVRS